MSPLKLSILCLCFIVGCSQKPQEQTTSSKSEDSNTKSIIFDTDIAGDYDDVGAMALLHAFADAGEIKILATISSNAFHTTAATMSVINTYFGRPELPIGITKRNSPKMDCKQKWAEALVEKFPHNVESNNDALDAVKLYRRILSQEPDGSVTLITVGFFTNLADLLDSKPDEYSTLNGKELIAKKVKLLVSMACGLEDGKNSWREYNVHVDATASQKVFTEWNTPMIISPFEVGEKIHTGVKLIGNDAIKDSPIKEAYRIALAADKNTVGRMSWDQTAVLVAARGVEPYFKIRRVNFRIDDDGTNVLIPGEKFSYLSFKQTPEEIQLIIEELMMHEPKKIN